MSKTLTVTKSQTFPWKTNEVEVKYLNNFLDTRLLWRKCKFYSNTNKSHNC